jgi:hypothetical protein
VNSGGLGTGEVCFDITYDMVGWQVSNQGTRTLTCNGNACQPPTVPPAVDGHRIIVIGAGMPSYTSISYW